MIASVGARLPPKRPIFLCVPICGRGGAVVGQSGLKPNLPDF